MGKRMNKTIICFGISILILCVVSMGIPVAESVETVLSHNHSLIDYSKYYVEYHNYISGETYRVNENNESQIRDKVEQDWTCDNAESGIVTSIARDRLSNIFDFHRVRSVASSTYTINALNTISQSPYSGVCQIYAVYKDQNNVVINIRRGSGCFISENAILTSAHCLKHETYGMPSAIRVYYCFETTLQGGTPYGNFAFCSAISSIICSTYNSNQDTMYDYAVINVASGAGGDTGVFMLANMTPTTSMELMAIGYPDATSGDGYGANGNTILSSPNPLKVCVGNLNKIASDYLRANHSSLDVEDGMSGGALTILNSNHNYELLGITSRTGIVMIFFDYAYFCRVGSSVKAFCAYYGGTNNVSSSLYLAG